MKVFQPSKENKEELNRKTFFLNDMMVNEIKDNERESSNAMTKLKIYCSIQLCFVTSHLRYDTICFVLLPMETHPIF